MPSYQVQVRFVYTHFYCDIVANSQKEAEGAALDMVERDFPHNFCPEVVECQETPSETSANEGPNSL